MKPLLSIIIPTYNCAAFLDETLGSVISQLPPDFELIVVDDGSTDETAEKLSGYEHISDNIRISYRSHKGASSARNAGIELAEGEYITFMDCDDCLAEGFLEKSRPLLDKNADLYIFGIERIPLDGNGEFWTVKNHYYASVSDFADEYIRKRQLLIYSNCNKFYRRSIFIDSKITFDEGMSFGEDRLVNYRYLPECRDVLTSEMIMLKYIQRSTESMSSKSVPGYFFTVMRLHDEKMRCFFKLSKGTTEEEKFDFLAYDISRETEVAIERFDDHPDEKAENLPVINKLIFGGPYDMDPKVDVLLVLGSLNCEYKIKAALETGRKNPGVKYILSGGNIHLSGKQSEAEFMKSYLLDHGIPASDIYLEDRATCTQQNLMFSYSILSEMYPGIRSEDAKSGSGKPVIGIITGGFHVPRVKMLLERLPEWDGLDIRFIPAYGPNTGLHNWYDNPAGCPIVFAELRKRIKCRLK